jgi:site-specific DNA recombinase
MTQKVPQEERTVKRVGIWVRVSTEDQAKGDSPEHHEGRGRYYADAKEWKVVEVYRLEAISGKSIIEQPETKRMLSDVKSGHITGLIFSKLARLARNTKELLEIAETFQRCGADLVSLQESIDTSTPSGRFFYTMFAGMAQWEREEIADRVAASVPIRARLGKPLGGAAPFGYQWTGRKLTPNPEESPIRKLIYELFLQHRRKKTVARLLNEAGYRTRNGSKFSDTTIDRLLQDPTAKGVRRSNYTKSLGEKKHWKLKPESEWVITSVEAIVAEETWEQCNQILNESRRRSIPPARKAVQLFGGLTYCGCGNKMYVPSNTPKYVCYTCRNKIPVLDLEKVFHEQLKSFFVSPKDTLAYLEQADATIKEKQELLLKLQKDLEKNASEMDKLMRLYLDDQISPQGFGERNRPLEERKRQLEAEIPDLMGEIDFLRIRYLSSDQVLTEARDLYSRWPELERQEKRQIIEHTVERIVIGKNDLQIDMAYMPSSPELMAKGQHNFTDSSPLPA